MIVGGPVKYSKGGKGGKREEEKVAEDGEEEEECFKLRWGL